MSAEENEFAIKSNFTNGDIGRLAAGMDQLASYRKQKKEKYLCEVRARADEIFIDIDESKIPLRVNQVMRRLYKEILVLRLGREKWVTIAKLFKALGCDIHWKTLEKAFLKEHDLRVRLTDAKCAFEKLAIEIGMKIDVTWTFDDDEWSIKSHVNDYVPKQKPIDVNNDDDENEEEESNLTDH